MIRAYSKSEYEKIASSITVILKTAKKEYKLGDKVVIIAYIRNIGKKTIEINKGFSKIRDPYFFVNDTGGILTPSSYHAVITEKKPNKTFLEPGKEMEFASIDFLKVALKYDKQKNDLIGSIVFSSTPVIYFYKRDKLTFCFADCNEIKFKIEK
jgi:hypothetical protein